MSNKNNPIVSALSQIVEQYGADILTNPTKVNTLLKDYAPSQSRESKLIVSALREGIGENLLAVADQDEVAQCNCVKKSIQHLVTDLYITESAAQFVIAAIALALKININNDARIMVKESQILTENTSTDEEIIISSLVTIAANENITFKNKNIHLRASIYCEGNLSFENCTLHCREANNSHSITTANTGTLSMSECVIRNYASSKSYALISTDTAMRFINCEFVDCCTFIWGAVSIDHCRVLDPGPNFIYAEMCEAAIASSEFSIQNEVHFVPDGDSKSVIKCFSLHFSECLVRSSQGMVLGNTIHPFIDIDDHSSIEHCIFQGLNYKVIRTYGLCNIRLTVFDHCISSKLLLECPQVNIEDCRFNQCADCLFVGDNATVVRCQFNYCESTIISAIGGTKIESCEFNNWVGKESADMIRFSSYGTAGGLRARLTQCVFRGMQAGKGFVVACSGAKDGPGVDVTDCKFVNCTTERYNAEIIQQYDSYFNLFGREKQFRIVYVFSCVGLDQINSGSGVTDFIPKVRTANGDPIGLSSGKSIDI